MEDQEQKFMIKGVGVGAGTGVVAGAVAGAGAGAVSKVGVCICNKAGRQLVVTC